MCAECHSTNLVKGFDPQTNSYKTTWSELDVSCEACHGPGSRHVAWAEVPPMGRARLDNAGLVMKTAGISNRELVELCAPCHSRRTELGDYDHRRSELLDNHLPVLLSEGVYYPDGQIQDEDFEYGSFVQSKMFRMGVRCTDCHDAHTLKLRKEGNDVCLQCHAAPATTTHATTFTRRSGRAAERRALVPVVPHAQVAVHGRPHAGRPRVRVPRPDLTPDLGVPNACSGCHRTSRCRGSATRRQVVRHGQEAALRRRARGGPPGRPGREGRPAEARRRRAPPTLVRATALSLLGRYQGADVAAAFRSALLDDEPLIRRTAVAEVPIEDASERASRLAPLLSDPFRAVRLEAAAQLAGTSPSLLRPYQQDALATALADYVKAMEHSLDFSAAGHNLGLLYERRNDPARAEVYYRKAVTVDDLWPPPKANLAILLARQGRTPRPRGCCARSSPRTRSRPRWPTRSGCWSPRRERCRRRRSCSRAPRRACRPSRGRPSHAGLALSQVGRGVEAERMLRRALELEPSSYDFAFALGDFLLRQKRFAEAVEVADRMTAIDASRPEAAELRSRAGRR